MLNFIQTFPLAINFPFAVSRTRKIGFRNSELYRLIIFGAIKENRGWMNKEDIDGYLALHKDDEDAPYGCAAIKNAREVFGAEYVRAYTGGIPQVWEDGLDSVRELLYPKWCFENDVLEERVTRFIKSCLVG